MTVTADPVMTSSWTVWLGGAPYASTTVPLTGPEAAAVFLHLIEAHPGVPVGIWPADPVPGDPREAHWRRQLAATTRFSEFVAGDLDDAPSRYPRQHDEQPPPVEVAGGDPSRRERAAEPDPL